MVTNLRISRVESRDEQSVDVVGSLCDRTVQVLHRVAAWVPMSCSLCDRTVQVLRRAAHRVAAWVPRVAASVTYGCSLRHIRLQVLRVAIDGPYLRARESVGHIFGGMLRKLAGFGKP